MYGWPKFLILLYSVYEKSFHTKIIEAKKIQPVLQKIEVNVNSR